MLHMIERAEKGGNSLFVDGFHVAEQVRPCSMKRKDMALRSARQMFCSAPPREAGRFQDALRVFAGIHRGRL